MRKRKTQATAKIFALYANTKNMLESSFLEKLFDNNTVNKLKLFGYKIIAAKL